jgi:hypothetical protein
MAARRLEGKMPMAHRKLVSEKTLELNLTAEFLTSIRAMRGCARVFWIGMKQYQEAKNGIDELIQGLPNGRHLALQFKSPRASRPNVDPYRYAINEAQNDRLLALAAGRPNAVHYVFPNFNTFARLRQAAPNLASHTVLYPVSLTNGLHHAPSGRHLVEVSESPPWVNVYSDVRGVPGLLLKDVLAESGPISEWIGSEGLVPNEELAQWLGGSVAQGDESPYEVGQRLRGFSTVCFPDGSARSG